MTRRVVTWSAVVSAVLLTVLLVAAPIGPPDAAGPEGTVGLERLLAGMGRGGDRAGNPVDGSSFLLIDDLRTRDEAEDLAEWVRSGGRLVLADPSSPLARELGVSPDGTVRGTPGSGSRLTPACAVPEVAGVEQVTARVSEATLTAEDPTVATACFASGDGHYLIALRHGAGRAVIIGGRAPFTNEFLRDDAAFVLSALGPPGTAVVIGEPVPGDRDATGLWQLLPDPWRAALIGVLIALLLVVAVRWRRLGMPPAEPMPSPLPASALSTATGRLLRASGDRGFAAELLRRDAFARSRRRLGIPADALPSDTAPLLAARADLAPREVEWLLTGPAPGDDGALIELAGRLRRLLTTISEEPR